MIPDIKLNTNQKGMALAQMQTYMIRLRRYRAEAEDWHGVGHHTTKEETAVQLSRVG